jgi:hypothetical protein
MTKTLLGSFEFLAFLPAGRQGSLFAIWPACAKSLPGGTKAGAWDLVLQNTDPV